MTRTRCPTSGGARPGQSHEHVAPQPRKIHAIIVCNGRNRPLHLAGHGFCFRVPTTLCGALHWAFCVGKPYPCTARQSGCVARFWPVRGLFLEDFMMSSAAGQIAGGAIGALIGAFSGGAAALSACVGGVQIGGSSL